MFPWSMETNIARALELDVLAIPEAVAPLEDAKLASLFGVACCGKPRGKREADQYRAPMKPG